MLREFCGIKEFIAEKLFKFRFPGTWQSTCFGWLVEFTFSSGSANSIPMGRLRRLRLFSRIIVGVQESDAHRQQPEANQQFLQGQDLKTSLGA
jgi:hypothetical protein